MVVKQYGIDMMVFYYVNLLHNQYISKMVVDSFQHASSIIHGLNIHVQQGHIPLLDNFFFGIVMPTNSLQAMKYFVSFIKIEVNFLNNIDNQKNNNNNYLID